MIYVKHLLFEEKQIVPDTKRQVHKESEREAGLTAPVPPQYSRQEQEEEGRKRYEAQKLERMETKGRNGDIVQPVLNPGRSWVPAGPKERSASPALSSRGQCPRHCLPGQARVPWALPCTLQASSQELSRPWG